MQMTKQDNSPTTSGKKSYSSPDIECIRMDSQISLQLDSNPMDGPGETFFLSNMHNNPDPYQTT